MMTAEPTALLRDAVSRLDGIDLWGVASVDAARGTPLGDAALALMPTARSILVFAKEVFDEVVDLVTPQKTMGGAAGRDLYTPHVEYVNRQLTDGVYVVARAFRSAGFRALPLPAAGSPTDGRFLKGIVSYKHAAEAAGLGRIGRNSLLVTERFGPRVRLACLLTDASVSGSTRISGSPCTDCSVCVERCPAGALTMPASGQPYAINKFACNQYVSASGGCANCVSLCPAGSR